MQNEGIFLMIIFSMVCFEFIGFVVILYLDGYGFLDGILLGLIFSIIGTCLIIFVPLLILDKVMSGSCIGNIFEFLYVLALFVITVVRDVKKIKR